RFELQLPGRNVHCGRSQAIAPVTLLRADVTPTALLPTPRCVALIVGMKLPDLATHHHSLAPSTERVRAQLGIAAYAPEDKLGFIDTTHCCVGRSTEYDLSFESPPLCFARSGLA